MERLPRSSRVRQQQTPLQAVCWAQAPLQVGAASALPVLMLLS